MFFLLRNTHTLNRYFWTNLIVLAILFNSSFSWAKAPPESFSTLYNSVKDSVVHISAARGIGARGQDDLYRFFGIPQDPAPQVSLGSGFITDPSGYILTNNHVIEKAEKITVKLANGKEYKARLIGQDSKTDTALLKIDTTASLPAVTMGDSDKAEVGDWVFAVGSPFGLSQTLTAGVISAKGRVIGSGPYDDFIQTDASINPGNSGGPLFNVSGEVVGINTAIYARAQGIGFAIPINIAKDLIPQFKKYGRIIRGWLGVYIQPMTDDLAKAFNLSAEKGVLVADLNPGGPAEKAGIERGDVIYSYNGKPLKDMTHFLLDVANTPVGTTVDIGIIRKSQRQTKKVRIAAYPDATQKVASATQETTQDIIVQEVPSDLAKSLTLKYKQSGVVVTGIATSSPVEASGIQVGDIIIEVNQKPVTGIKSFYNILGSINKGETVLIFAIRRNIPAYFTYIK